MTSTSTLRPALQKKCVLLSLTRKSSGDHLSLQAQGFSLRTQHVMLHQVMFCRRFLNLKHSSCRKQHHVSTQPHSWAYRDNRICRPRRHLQRNRCLRCCHSIHTRSACTRSHCMCCGRCRNRCLCVSICRSQGLIRCLGHSRCLLRSRFHSRCLCFRHCHSLFLILCHSHRLFRNRCLRRSRFRSHCLFPSTCRICCQCRSWCRICRSWCRICCLYRSLCRSRCLHQSRCLSRCCRRKPTPFYW